MLLHVAKATLGFRVLGFVASPERSMRSSTEVAVVKMLQRRFGHRSNSVLLVAQLPFKPLPFLDLF